MKFYKWKIESLKILKSKLKKKYNEFIEKRQLNKIFNISIKNIPVINIDEYQLNNKEIQELNKILDKYLDGCPLDYIEGYAGFYKYDFIVTEDVLIPRFDSEILIDTVIDLWNSELYSEKTILEFGVGSGNLSISLALLSKKWKIYGVEKSIQSLNVAIKNFKNIICNGANIEFIHGDWRDDNFIEKLLSLSPNGYDLIISNPPYLSIDEYYNSIDTLKYEPVDALVSANNGLFDLERIAKISKKLLNNGILLLEHGSSQQNILINLLYDLGYKNIERIKDLSNLDRAVMAKYTS